MSPAQRKRMQPRILRCRKHKFDLSKKTLVMGILNVTPDSFSDGGLYLNHAKALRRAVQIENEGADIIDIGGESTRPGAKSISVQEELGRVIPLISKLKKRIRIPISVDTTKYEVAKAALEEGVSIVNDISGLTFDDRLASLCAHYSAGLVIMHIKGKPRTMQKRVSYCSLIQEIKLFLKKGVKIALSNGLRYDNIIIDPGIGFGKKVIHNIGILRELKSFTHMGFPLMIGLSRKSFLGKILNAKVDERLIPTIAANAIAIYNGADIIRVHDVRESVAVSRLVGSVVNYK
ncbi:dihydropteroate synthase [Candidatus Omnitrophota bacterium]